MEFIPLVLGPTAAGKTELAHRAARVISQESEKTEVEIISADSRAIYKRLNIGTATPLPRQRRELNYHLISFLDPRERYSAMDFRRDVEEKLEEITSRGNLPLLVGGSRLYIKALTEGIFEGPSADEELRESLSKKSGEELHGELEEVDPPSAEKIHPHDKKRLIRALEVHRLTGRPISELKQEAEPISQSVKKIGLKKSKEELYRQIGDRVEEMLERGLLEEVEELVEAGFGPEWGSWETIGYKELVPVVQGDRTLEEAKELIKKNTRHLARYQLSWLRSEGEVNWIDLEERGRAEAEKAILKFLRGAKYRLP